MLGWLASGGESCHSSFPNQKPCNALLYLPGADEGTIGMGFAFAFDSSAAECKVASVYTEELDYGREVGFNVLSIGKDDNWRTLKLPDQNERLLQKKRYYSICIPLLNEGVAHWVEIIRDGEELTLEVQSFDIWSECFTITILPRGAFSDSKKVTAFVWNKYLAVADIVEDSLNVLVLEDFKEHKWSEITVPLKFLQDNQALQDKIRPLVALLDDLYFTMQ